MQARAPNGKMWKTEVPVSDGFFPLSEDDADVLVNLLVEQYRTALYSLLEITPPWERENG